MVFTDMEVNQGMTFCLAQCIDLADLQPWGTLQPNTLSISKTIRQTANTFAWN